MNKEYRLISSPWGNILLEASSVGLSRISLGSSEQLENSAGEVLSRAERSLARYFNGENVAWDLPLDLSASSGLEREVWEVIRRIPYGETRTYRWVAEQVGRSSAARAVGSALGRNPVPIIVPCHRVVRSDGTLGGYSGGLGWKVNLLGLEGVRIEKCRRIER